MLRFIWQFPCFCPFFVIDQTEHFTILFVNGSLNHKAHLRKLSAVILADHLKIRLFKCSRWRDASFCSSIFNDEFLFTMEVGCTTHPYCYFVPFIECLLPTFIRSIVVGGIVKFFIYSLLFIQLIVSGFIWSIAAGGITHSYISSLLLIEWIISKLVCS